MPHSDPFTHHVGYLLSGAPLLASSLLQPMPTLLFHVSGREASSSSRKLVISPSLSFFFMFVDALYSLHMMMGSSKIGPLSSPSSFYPQGVLLGHLAQKNNVNNHLVSAKLFTCTISLILTRTQNTLKYLDNSKRFLNSKTHLRPLLPISQKPGFFVTGNL